MPNLKTDTLRILCWPGMSTFSLPFGIAFYSSLEYFHTQGAWNDIRLMINFKNR